jgi:hypothetical protein
VRRRMALTIALFLGVASAWLASEARCQESPSAKSARKRLQEKITVELADTRLKDAIEDIKREMSKPVSFKIDNISGISNNMKVSYTAKDKTVQEILNDLCDKYEMGYFVLSKPGDRYDGWVILRKGKGKERGYEAGKEPAKDKSEEEVLPAPDVFVRGIVQATPRYIFLQRP